MTMNKTIDDVVNQLNKYSNLLIGLDELITDLKNSDYSSDSHAYDQGYDHGQWVASLELEKLLDKILGVKNGL